MDLDPVIARTPPHPHPHTRARVRAHTRKVILFNMYLVIMTVNVDKKNTKLVTLASLATLCQAYFLANHAHLSRPGVLTSLGGDTVIAIIEWYVLCWLYFDLWRGVSGSPSVCCDAKPIRALQRALLPRAPRAAGGDVSPGQCV